MFRFCISAFLISAIFSVSARADDVYDTYPFKFRRWEYFNERLTQNVHAFCQNFPKANGPSDVFPQTQELYDLGNKCIAETCGTDNRKYVKAMPDLFSGIGFSNKYKGLIDKAIKNSSENERRWLAAHVDELKKNRPFSALTTDQQILSAILYPNDSSTLDYFSSQERAQIDTRAKANSKIKERFWNAEEKYEKKFSTQSTGTLKQQTQELADSLKEKFGHSAVMADLTPYIKNVQENFKVSEAGGNSTYYRNLAISNLAFLSSMSEALEKKEEWKKDLVDLGTPNKDIPSLDLAYKTNAVENEFDVESSIKDCADRAGERISHLPTRAQIQKIKASVEKTKKKIQDRYLSKLSAHSRKDLNKLLVETEINLPPAKEDYEKAMVAKFEILGSSQYGSDIAGPANSYEFQTTQTYRSYMREACEGVPANGSDEADAQGKKVNFSELALSDNAAESVIAHELFHVLDPSQNLLNLSEESMREINKSKECVVGLHGKNNFYLTEDWADAGAAMIVSDTSERITCEHIKAYNKYVYSSDKDNHSPYMLRMLHQQIYKKEGLSPSCKKFVEKYIPQLTKKCF